MNRIIMWLGMIVIIFCIIGMSVVTYWLVYPYKVVTFKDPVIPVIKKTLIPGEAIQIRLRYTKHINTPSIFMRKLVNDAVITLPEQRVHRPNGTYDFISYATAVPSHTIPGHYKLVMSFVYEVNPLRTITVEKETELFEVVR